MTVEAYTPPELYTVSGTGPYAFNHAFRADEDIVVSIVDGTVITPLNGGDYSVTPNGGSAGGIVTLIAGAAATHAGKKLRIDRDTAREQGFVGATSREKGMERQLDAMVMAIQENAERGARALVIQRGNGPTPEIPAIAEGHTIVADAAGGFAQGPSKGEIEDAASNAAEATASAGAAAASAGSAAASSAAAGAASGRLDVGSFAELATKFTYGTPGTGQQQVAAGDVILWRSKKIAYVVASLTAPSAYFDYTGSGGVKLDVLQDADGFYNFAATGADRTGAADCAAALKAFWDKYHSVIVPAGTYLIGSIVDPGEAGDFLHMKAHGATFKMANGANLNGMIKPKAADVCWVEGGRFDGNKANQTGGTFGALLDFSDIDFAQADDVHAFNSKTDGIDIRANSSGVMNNCRIDTCDLSGVKVTGTCERVSLQSLYLNGSQTNLQIIGGVNELDVLAFVDGQGTSTTGILINALPNPVGDPPYGSSGRISIRGSVKDCNGGASGGGISILSNDAGTMQPVHANIYADVSGCRDGILLREVANVNIYSGMIDDNDIRGLSVAGCRDVNVWGARFRNHDNHPTASAAVSVASQGATVSRRIYMYACKFTNATSVNSPVAIAASSTQVDVRAIDAFYSGFTTNFGDNVRNVQTAGSRLRLSGGETTVSAVGVEAIRFENGSATVLATLTGGLPGQEVYVTASNSNTSIDYRAGTAGGVIRNGTLADVALTVDKGFTLKRDFVADFWRIVAH